MALGKVCLRGCVLVVPMKLPTVSILLLKHKPDGNAELAKSVYIRSERLTAPETDATRPCGLR